ncbi:GNAT family N-acetyltransferase [Halomonas binhaiensis]|uniref:GNAT family N-acetyltransferase n=1 Tax=Halomonas binhaiensis TaxID=2562282 RepID=A0A5C1NKC7_9GAMM|nr:GNAT family N-acetyltransferase [Halomonas binhaiensis]QEM83083.1 GNAT family N-acetyltransferase [Halomonas binhaiensis]
MRAWTIERLEADSPHLAKVAAWTYEAWGHLHPDSDFESWSKEVASFCGNGGVPSVFVAMRDGKPVGTASLSPDDMSIRREYSPWLASVFVLPEQRGQGLASALVRRVEDEAREHGVNRLYLYTPDQQSLYRRLGWRDLEALSYRGEDVTVMYQPL